MAVKVISGEVDTGSRVFRKGELIQGLSERDELDLVQKGVCERVVLFEPPSYVSKAEALPVAAGDSHEGPPAVDLDNSGDDEEAEDEGPPTAIPGLELPPEEPMEPKQTRRRK